MTYAILKLAVREESQLQLAIRTYYIEAREGDGDCSLIRFDQVYSVFVNERTNSLLVEVRDKKNSVRSIFLVLEVFKSNWPIQGMSAKRYDIIEYCLDSSPHVFVYLKREINMDYFGNI